VYLIRVNFSYQFVCSNAARGNCLVDAQYFDFSLALSTMAERPLFTAHPQYECFVAFGRDQNFLCVCHDLVLQSALT